MPDLILPLARSRTCPQCGGRTTRVRTPWALRWLKALFGTRFSYRKCLDCYRWVGLVLVSRELAHR